MWLWFSIKIQDNPPVRGCLLIGRGPEPSFKHYPISPDSAPLSVHWEGECSGHAGGTRMHKHILVPYHGAAAGREAVAVLLAQRCIAYGCGPGCWMGALGSRTCAGCPVTLHNNLIVIHSPHIGSSVHVYPFLSAHCVWVLPHSLLDGNWHIVRSGAFMNMLNSVLLISSS